MTSGQQSDLEPNQDAALEAIVAAILDGTPVDWTSLSGSGAAAEFGSELRVVADIAAVHRSLADDDSEPTLFPPAFPWEVGTLTITDSLGRGTYGEVFRAWDKQLHRDVAVKLLFAGARRGDTSSRALDEGRLLARVRHPNVVTVHAVEQIEGRVGLVTEYVQGRTLADVLRESGPFSVSGATEIGLSLCHALEAVHGAGLVHRDIKAQNVMREAGGRVVLMDFGTGHEFDAFAGATGGLRGTPLYLAPELFDGAPASIASDIYAMAVLLFHLLTGQYPVEGRTLEDVRSAHQQDRTQRLREVRPDIPEALSRVIQRGFAADPRRRYESARAFADALSHWDPATRGRGSRLSVRSAVGMTIAASVIASASAILMLRSSPGAPASAGAAVPLGVAPSTTYRKLNPPFSDAPGRPSGDGRYLPYVAFPDGNLWYWEIATGVSRQVTRKPADSPEGGGWSAMSPDGGRVAYSWWTGNEYELRIANADGTEVRSILARGTAESPIPLEWSRDGSQLLCKFEHQDGQVDLALVPADGGSPRILHTFRRGQPRQASLSPDGRFVVYDFPHDFRTMRSAVMILGTDGSEPRALIDEPANNMNPFWTPDGSRVFFTSDRSASIDGWVVDVANGVAVGEPKLAARNLGLVRPAALTSDGVYHYGLDTSEIDVYTMPVTLIGNTPSVTGKPARVSPAVVGGHVGPSWSPDGRSLAVIRRVPSTGITLIRGANSITIIDVSSGRQREVIPQLSELQIASPQWSPDSRSLAVRGTSLENRLGYFRVDVRTGEARPLLLIDSPKNESDYGVFRWFDRGRALVYRHAPRGLVARDISTGLETVVVDWNANGLSGFHGFAVSPDGRSLAFSAMSSKDGQAARTVFVKAANGAPREVFRAPSGEFAVVQAWTPDDREVLFTRYRPGQDAAIDPHQLWKVPAVGGSAQDTTARIPGYTQPYWVALSPNGRRLAYTAGMTSGELWVMENFLPDPR